MIFSYLNQTSKKSFYRHLRLDYRVVKNRVFPQVGATGVDLGSVGEQVGPRLRRRQHQPGWSELDSSCLEIEDTVD